MKKPFSILLFLLSIPAFTFAQTALNYGPEIGVSFSCLPQIKKENTTRGQSKIRNLPLPGPMFGFSGILTLNKNIQISLGMQYQISGNRDRYTSARLAIDNQGNATGGTDRVEMVENLTLHKVCLPLTLGYTFGMLRLKPAFYLGARPNYFLTGKYHSRVIVDFEDNSNDLFTETIYNPVSPQQAAVPVSRVNLQLLAGISTQVGKRIRANLSVSRGQHLYFSQFPPWDFWMQWTTGYKNIDLTMSVTCLLNTKN
jgi:hypothetical protein